MTSLSVLTSWRPPSAADSWQTSIRECASLEETKQMAFALASTLAPGMTLALSGALGAGKTTLVRFLAEAFKVLHPSEVTSPTYSLMHIYETQTAARLVHLDLYRLENTPAVRALGLDEELTQDDALVLVEWAELMPEILPAATLWLRLEVLGPARRRCILFSRSDEVRL